MNDRSNDTQATKLVIDKAIREIPQYKPNYSNVIYCTEYEKLVDTLESCPDCPDYDYCPEVTQ